MNRPAALAALVSESFEGLARARRMTSLSVALIAISIGLVGAFFLVAENLRSVVETVRDESAVTVFLKSSATEAERADLERLAKQTRLVARVRRVSPDEARARFSTWWKSLGPAARSLPGNPFPASLEMELDPSAAASDALPPFLKLLAAHPATEEVQFDVEWIRRLRGAVSLARLTGLVLAVFLTLGAAFTIANVVRLTILLHRDEIEILRLVGAPELLIRGPFVLGGLVQGLLGGAAAVGL
ncbi:MAG TPA: permease-like cell division protein FtsX, partial [Thermoanaerobaculia bacterium]|nr:permease-like cell division protein FtsX [Thermoanaerobaculia bacterium]